MRLTAIAAFAALSSLCFACAVFGGSASAQSAEPDAVATADSGLAIDWEVKSRFRLFKRESDFQRHVSASQAGSELAAEHLLEQGTDGRGWAQREVDHLCLNPAGQVLDTCERDGERENYLAPAGHLIVARLTGAVPAGATCNWSFDDGTIPPKQVSAPCAQPVQQRVATASRPSPRSA